jgi:hypothetical protein
MRDKIKLGDEVKALFEYERGPKTYRVVEINGPRFKGVRLEAGHERETVLSGLEYFVKTSVYLSERREPCARCGKYIPFHSHVEKIDGLVWPVNCERCFDLDPNAYDDNDRAIDDWEAWW